MYPTLFGMRIVTNPLLDNYPRVKLSAKLAAIISTHNPSFVKEYDDWLREFFGTEHMVFVNKEQKTIFVGPQGLEKIKQDLEKEYGTVRLP